jgi:hypothetical protein
MDTALVVAYILVASVNAAGVFVLWRYVRDWSQLLLRPRVFIHRGNVPDCASGCVLAELSYPTRAKMLDAMLGGGLSGLDSAARAPYTPLGSMTARFTQRTDEISYQRDKLIVESKRDLFERALRAQLGPGTLRAPASPLSSFPLFFPSGLVATSRTAIHAASLTEKNRMTTNTFYVLKTARTPAHREGRFVVIDSDGEAHVGPANAVMGSRVVSRFATIGELLAAVERVYGLSDATIRGLRICKVTETTTEPMRAVEEVTLSAAKTAKLVVRLAKPGSYQLYRQGNRQQYGELATAQVFDGLADLQRRAPQTYSNPEREVLALVEQPGRSTFTEVEVG